MVVRAGLAVVDDVDLVTDRGRSVERRLTEDARFRRTRARDRDDAGRVHVRGFRRPMVCVLLLAAGGAARALRIAAEVGLVIVIGRDLAAVRDLGFAVRRRRGPRLRRGVARLARILRAAVVQVGVRADRVVAGRDSLVAELGLTAPVRRSRAVRRVGAGDREPHGLTRCWTACCCRHGFPLAVTKKGRFGSRRPMPAR